MLFAGLLCTCSGPAVCDIVCPPWEEDGVGAQQNQDSGNLASPVGLDADVFRNLTV